MNIEQGLNSKNLDIKLIFKERIKLKLKKRKEIIIKLIMK